jgi:hypothetical protein
MAMVFLTLDGFLIPKQIVKVQINMFEALMLKQVFSRDNTTYNNMDY